MAGSTLLTDEMAIQHAILNLMKDGRVWTNGELKRRLAHALPWTKHELGRPKDRESEYRWENRINNALSPSRSSSLYGKGFVENVEHGRHRITAKGLAFINEDDFTVDDLLIDV